MSSGKRVEEREKERERKGVRGDGSVQSGRSIDMHQHETIKKRMKTKSRSPARYVREKKKAYLGKYV